MKELAALSVAFPLHNCGKWILKDCVNGKLKYVSHLFLDRYSPLAEQFAQQFPGHDLPSMLAKFSLPVSLAEFRNPLEAPAQEVGLLYD